MSVKVPVIPLKISNRFETGDIYMILAVADETCECTDEMRKNLYFDTAPTTCLPCACRFTLNALGTLLDRVKVEFN